MNEDYETIINETIDFISAFNKGEGITFMFGGSKDTEISKYFFFSTINKDKTYISKQIVELHKGQIWAESEGINKGSTFNILLPIK